MANVLNQPEVTGKLLEKLRLNCGKYVDIKESKNLIAVHEQILFIWHDAESCILTTEIISGHLKDGSFKILSVTNPPVFDVESLAFNQTGSLLALSGKNGVMTVEVPWRYGKIGSVGINEENVLGRSWNIAEYFFVSSNRVIVLQASWHPGSSSSTHLTVLSSDNYIRIYDVTDPQTPQQVICLGKSLKSSYLSSESKASFSTCFGEIAVSFDFGPPEIIHLPEPYSLNNSRTLKEETVWPIFLLHGNGDVYILKLPLKKRKLKSDVKLEGPLVMYPSSEDNYGYDACSILCLPSVPACLVIATSSGIIYHCLFLENFSSDVNREQKLPVSWNPESNDEFDGALYVFESVELPLTLTEEQDEFYSHPIRLYKDITSQYKYHTSHVTGIHSVAVPFLQVMEESLNAEKLEKLLTDQEKRPSIVEHILCTKLFSQMDAVPLMGVDTIPSDTGVIMVCLLASWEFIFLPLVSSYFPPPPNLLTKILELSKSDHCDVSLGFEQHIEKTLQRSMCSPFLKSFMPSGQVKTSSQQWLDLLCNITQRFREDYIQRLNTAQALLRSRIKVLTQQKEYQLKDISRCQQERENLRNGAERLAEKYEDVQSKQTKLMEGVEDILRKLQNRLPYLTKAEMEMKQTLVSYEDKMKLFECSLDQIKKKLKNRKEKIRELNEAKRKSGDSHESMNLTEIQLKHIKELLMQETESIAELVKTITSLKKQIGL